MNETILLCVAVGTGTKIERSLYIHVYKLKSKSNCFTLINKVSICTWLFHSKRELQHG